MDEPDLIAGTVPASTVRVDRLVDASAEQVFAVLADPWSYADWVCGTAAIRDADERWPAVGSRLWHRFGRWPLCSDDYSQVLACEPPYRLVLRANVRPFGVVRAVMSVDEVRGQSITSITEEVLSGPIARFGSLTGHVQRRRNARSLEQLARLAERPQPG